MSQSDRGVVDCVGQTLKNSASRKWRMEGGSRLEERRKIGQRKGDSVELLATGSTRLRLCVLPVVDHYTCMGREADISKPGHRRQLRKMRWSLEKLNFKVLTAVSIEPYPLFQRKLQEMLGEYSRTNSEVWLKSVLPLLKYINF